MGSWSVTWHPAELTFPPLPQPKLVLDLATPERCKARPLVGRKKKKKSARRWEGLVKWARWKGRRETGKWV